MADITPLVSLNGELAMPEKVWMQGPPGPQGQQGEPGAAATVTVGTVTTGEPGTDAIVTNSGTENAAVLDFTIPKGDTGATGPAGADGVSPTVSTSKSGNVTTITIVDSSGTKTATINDGAKGDTGPAGPAGAGVPDGGTAGQLLSKTESGTAWIDPPQSGASSSDVFIIHATTDETNTNAQLDKTTEQIYEAYQSGKYCLVYSEGKFLPVESVETYGAKALVRCGGLTFTGNQGMVGMISYQTNDGVTWATAFESPMLYNVCFFGLKIYGLGGRMYTISVDADGNLTATEAT